MAEIYSPDLPGWNDINDIDFRLHSIVSAIETRWDNGTEIRVPCALVVNGAVLEGELTSRRDWADHNASRANGPIAEAMMYALTSDSRRALDDDAEVATEQGHKDYYRLHLVNLPSGRSWRIRSKDVVAWSLGAVTG